MIMPTQESLNQHLAFVNLYTSMQKISSFHLFIFEIQSILGSCNQTGHTHFWPYPPPLPLPSSDTHTHTNTQMFDQLLISVNLYKHTKNGVIPSVHPSDTVNFRILSPHWLQPFLTMPTTKISNHFLICMNLYQYAKNHFIPSVSFWDTVNFRVQKPDWANLYFDNTSQKIFKLLFFFLDFY